MNKQTTRFITQYEALVPGGEPFWHDWAAPSTSHIEAETLLQGLVLTYRMGDIIHATGRYRVICRVVVVTENLIGEVLDLNAIPV